jgi:hypothetical protein
VGQINGRSTVGLRLVDLPVDLLVDLLVDLPVDLLVDLPVDY